MFDSYFIDAIEEEYEDIMHKPNLLEDADPVNHHIRMSSKVTEPCKPYHRHLRNDKNSFKNVTTSSNIYHKEIRCCKLSSRKKYRPRHCVHNIKRPYLDFEKMQKVSY